MIDRIINISVQPKEPIIMSLTCPDCGCNRWTKNEALYECASCGHPESEYDVLWHHHFEENWRRYDEERIEA